MGRFWDCLHLFLPRHDLSCPSSLRLLRLFLLLYVATMSKNCQATVGRFYGSVGVKCVQDPSHMGRKGLVL